MFEISISNLNSTQIADGISLVLLLSLKLSLSNRQSWSENHSLIFKQTIHSCPVSFSRLVSQVIFDPRKSYSADIPPFGSFRSQSHFPPEHKSLAWYSELATTNQNNSFSFTSNLKNLFIFCGHSMVLG